MSQREAEEHIRILKQALSMSERAEEKAQTVLRSQCLFKMAAVLSRCRLLMIARAFGSIRTGLLTSLKEDRRRELEARTAQQDHLESLQGELEAERQTIQALQIDLSHVRMTLQVCCCSVRWCRGVCCCSVRGAVGFAAVVWEVPWGLLL